jgi:hypothetical protein
MVIISIKLRIMKSGYEETEEGAEDSKKWNDAVTVFRRHWNSS